MQNPIQFFSRPKIEEEDLIFHTVQMKKLFDSVIYKKGLFKKKMI